MCQQTNSLMRASCRRRGQLLRNLWFHDSASTQPSAVLWASFVFGNCRSSPCPKRLDQSCGAASRFLRLYSWFHDFCICSLLPLDLCSPDLPQRSTFSIQTSWESSAEVRQPVRTLPVLSRSSVLPLRVSHLRGRARSRRVFHRDGAPLRTRERHEASPERPTRTRSSTHQTQHHGNLACTHCLAETQHGLRDPTQRLSSEPPRSSQLRCLLLSGDNRCSSQFCRHCIRYRNPPRAPECCCLLQATRQSDPTHLDHPNGSTVCPLLRRSRSTPFHPDFDGPAPRTPHSKPTLWPRPLSNSLIGFLKRLHICGSGQRDSRLHP